ncbi:MAG: acid phosphatase [Microlunatus sp.]|nr:acid phosphatase [Microlunatus sp.]
MNLLRSVAAIAIGTCALVAGLVASPAAAATTLPTYRHVVLVMFENHGYAQVIGSPQAPYLTRLAKQGANFTQSYAIQHPSEPNYLELFSGSNHGVNNDSCPHSFSANNLAHQVIGSGRTFVGYSEGLPAAGSLTCSSGLYARKHAPWTNFTDLSQRAVSKPYSAFPSTFSGLPSHAWVIPNLCHDMHNCSVGTGDAWAKAHLDPYAQWAKTHNSLLIVTFDEDDSSGNNRIATFFVGAHIRKGNYSTHIDHYRVLRTIEGIFRLPALGAAKNRTPITSVFTATSTAAGPAGTGSTPADDLNATVLGSLPSATAIDAPRWSAWMMRR